MVSLQPLDETALPALLARFYAKVRLDDALGPLFNQVIQDWDNHLERISDFWSSVMLASGRYKGNPVVIHLMHAHRISPEMFDRWLALWEETTSEMLQASVAAAMQAKARRIAETLKGALRLRGGPPTNPAREPSSSIALPG
ncbi:MAG TPA: group III truncated hemoglobin [Inquilinus sp.]